MDHPATFELIAFVWTSRTLWHNPKRRAASAVACWMTLSVQRVVRHLLFLDCKVQSARWSITILFRDVVAPFCNRKGRNEILPEPCAFQHTFFFPHATKRLGTRLLITGIVVSMWLVLAPATVINTKIGLDRLSLEACLMAWSKSLDP